MEKNSRTREEQMNVREGKNGTKEKRITIKTKKNIEREEPTEDGNRGERKRETEVNGKRANACVSSGHLTLATR